MSIEYGRAPRLVEINDIEIILVQKYAVVRTVFMLQT